MTATAVEIVGGPIFERRIVNLAIEEIISREPTD
jgi:hypothetical protein